MACVLFHIVLDFYFNRFYNFTGVMKLKWEHFVYSISLRLLVGSYAKHIHSTSYFVYYISEPDSDLDKHDRAEVAGSSKVPLSNLQWIKQIPVVQLRLGNLKKYRRLLI